MTLLSESEAYDRNRILDDAARARSRGKRRRAIALYRRVLAVEPQNGDLHHKVAPLLSESGQLFDAWLAYRTAARGFVREDRTERALAVYREACERLPQELDAWLEATELLRRQGRSADAVRTLLDARHHFRHRWQRPIAIHLLRRVLSFEPGNVDVLVDLSTLLARSDQRSEALLLLERAGRRASGAELRRVWRARFGLTRSLRDGWRWVRAARGPVVRPEPSHVS